MTPEQFERVKELFDDALGLSGDARARFLTEATSDPDVRAEVARLLSRETHDGAMASVRAAIGDALVSSPDNAVRHESDATGESPTDTSQIANGRDRSPTLADVERSVPFRVLRQVGEGGMGSVYEAEQEYPVRRTVALKLIKWGMDTKQVIVRFESERQAIALMNYRNIASVYEADCIVPDVNHVPLAQNIEPASSSRLNLTHRELVFRKRAPRVRDHRRASP